MKYIDAERLKAEVKRIKNDYNRNSFVSGLAYLGKEEAIDEFCSLIDSLQQEQPDEHYTKRNELFDKCVANCDPKVMQDVSDNVDKLRAISTPAEEDWFKVAEEWEKEDK